MNPGGSGPRDPWKPGSDDEPGDYGQEPSADYGSAYGTSSGYGTGSGSGYDYEPGPWGAPPPQPPPGSPFLKIVMVIGILMVLGVGACGACAFFGYRFASGMLGDQVAESLRGNPVIDEHIGEIESIKLDLIASGSEPEPDVFVFDVVGSLGGGRLVVQTLTIDADTEEVLSGYLEMEDGSRHDLFPHGRDSSGPRPMEGELQGPKK